MKIHYAGWSTGTVWGKPGGPPPGEMWSIAFASTTEEERTTLATHAEAVLHAMGAQNTDVGKGFATTYIALSLTKEQVHARFNDTNWQTLPQKFVELFEQEMQPLKEAADNA